MDSEQDAAPAEIVDFAEFFRRVQESRRRPPTMSELLGRMRRPSGPNAG